jgi:hypothetical protein
MKKYFFILILVIVAIAIIIYGANLFSPGSYSDSEKFELPINEADLIIIIENFKNENPEYKVPAQVKLIDGRSNPQDHWYHVYFYYKQENQIIYTWVRSSGKEKTVLAFVAVNNGLELGKWKDINKDFDASENRNQIEKFENRIFKQLETKVK